jgi:hypothetical protein
VKRLAGRVRSVAVVLLAALACQRPPARTDWGNAELFATVRATAGAAVKTAEIRAEACPPESRPLSTASLTLLLDSLRGLQPAKTIGVREPWKRLAVVRVEPPSARRWTLTVATRNSLDGAHRVFFEGADSSIPAGFYDDPEGRLWQRLQELPEWQEIQRALDERFKPCGEIESAPTR